MVFNEREAIEILHLINERIAKIFHRTPLQARFVFLSYIASRNKNKVVTGQCVPLPNGVEIQIQLVEGWQKTAVHELVHAYNPHVSERLTKAITNDVVLYLKYLVSQHSTLWCKDEEKGAQNGEELMQQAQSSQSCSPVQET